jgi:hypothetical protein
MKRRPSLAQQLDVILSHHEALPLEFSGLKSQVTLVASQLLGDIG